MEQRIDKRSPRLNITSVQIRVSAMNVEFGEDNSRTVWKHPKSDISDIIALEVATSGPLLSFRGL
ncbi:hypothetical protein CCM_02580 [Cordyceps militaris CM01]|uniref:Uncharacterized protein n=1 Tax=Cordyceps militaris (strain CM01) TaxID=983644 RepID=G3JAJ3_CORMM|nr:uncharacterized protein CCM_02580 [Cordyceps militaris CM01]EGX94309.1 hypothetical protein CCM_02580 [Cordyceps militaris CM01]